MIHVAFKHVKIILKNTEQATRHKLLFFFSRQDEMILAYNFVNYNFFCRFFAASRKMLERGVCVENLFQPWDIVALLWTHSNRLFKNFQKDKLWRHLIEWNALRGASEREKAGPAQKGHFPWSTTFKAARKKVFFEAPVWQCPVVRVSSQEIHYSSGHSLMQTLFCRDINLVFCQNFKRFMHNL